MLSIIISSYQPKFYDALVQNISETIGMDFLYEIIQIKNPNLMGICKAYNIGAVKSNYENLLFLHEDLQFHTENWGLKLIEHLSAEKSGVIGVAGGSYVPSAPTSWATAKAYNHVSLIQNDSSRENGIIYKQDSLKINAFAIDGVFMAVTKKVYLKNPFNEKIEGFHGYDLDFSLRIAKNFNNYVVGDILLEHFSKGRPDMKWFKNNIEIRKNLGHNFNRQKNSRIEEDFYSFFLRDYLINYGFTLKNFVRSLQFYPFISITLRGHFRLLKHIYMYFKYKKEYMLKYEKFT